MSKTVRKVFLIIGTLVAIFLIWQLVFNDGGILKTGYNALAHGINEQFAKVAGGTADSKQLLPYWGEGDNKTENNGKGFDIDTGKKN